MSMLKLYIWHDALETLLAYSLIRIQLLVAKSTTYDHSLMYWKRRWHTVYYTVTHRGIDKFDSSGQRGNTTHFFENMWQFIFVAEDKKQRSEFRGMYTWNHNQRGSAARCFERICNRDYHKHQFVSNNKL